jgi:hypothetical protein
VSGDEGYHGHMTMADGSHAPLSKDDAAALWRRAEEVERDRAERWPTDQHAISAMTDAFHRLKTLGWREAMYCPKDGTAFEVIEAGSSGIHTCHYDGEWPTGTWWVHGEGDLWPSRPILFRPIAPKGE